MGKSRGAIVYDGSAPGTKQTCDWSYENFPLFVWRRALTYRGGGIGAVSGGVQRPVSLIILQKRPPVTWQRISCYR